MSTTIQLWKDLKISGMDVGHVVLDDTGGLKLVVLIKTGMRKNSTVKSHVFHLPSGEPVKRLSKQNKEDVEQAIQIFKEEVQ